MLDYASMSVGQIRDDLRNTLSDLVVNAGQRELAPLLDELEVHGLSSTLEEVSGAPSGRLVAAMTALAEMEPFGHLPPEGVEQARAAVRELQAAAGHLL